MPNYRRLFLAGVVYHLACGIVAVFFPHALLAILGLPESYAAAIRACPGALCGALALGCLLAVNAPVRSRIVAAILLAVHLLVTSGWLVAVARGELPSQTFPALLINDLVWLFPLTFVLLQGRRWGPCIIAEIGVGLHIAACIGLLAVSGGTEVVADMAKRAKWVRTHPAAWTTTWMFWALASMSLLAFAIVWTARLLQAGVSRRWALLGCAVLGLGVLFDLVGESINLVGPTLPGCTVEQFAFRARTYAILSAGTANGLYCIGGLLLSTLAWRVGWLRGWLGALGLVMWTVGLGLTVMVVLNNGPGMIATGGAVMMLYIPWSAIVGWRLPKERARAVP